ncbi:MAG: type IV toxin-antitoxin system AbiEi family antitoxin domain-containing protein [Atribacterota bacterium]
MKFEELVRKFKSRPFIELKEVTAFTEDSEQQIKNQFYHWARQGKLERLRRGCYILAEPFRKYLPSVYYISNYLYRPSYVSLYSALQFHGMIPEAVFQIQAVTSKHGQEWDTSLGTFKYYSIKQERFWGYEEVSTEARQTQNKFFMALPEKAILDLFYFQKGDWPLKRIKEMRFQETDNIDTDVLKKFALKYNSPKIEKAADNFLKYKEKNKV